MFKTLHITNAWHPQSGGIRTFYLALLDAANIAGQSMHLVVPAENDDLEAIGRHGVIHYVKAPFAPGSKSYRILFPNQYLWPGSKVHNILRHEQPDLVEFCDKYTLTYLGGLLRIGLLPGIGFRPAVVGLTCERFTDSVRNYFSAGPVGGWLTQLYLRWLYFPLADHHIAVSNHVASELEAVSDRHKVNRSVWLGPMGVDYGAFHAVDPQPGLRNHLLAMTGANSNAVLLLFAGRMAREKNIPLLFETVQRLGQIDPNRDYRLLLAGDGDERAALEATARQMAPGKAFFLGYRSKTDLARLCKACDIFLHPNPREPFGIGPLEAMAAGLPLVAPNTGGVTNYANADNAWLVEATAHEFAGAIQDVASDPEARQAKIENAQATAQSHDWSRAAGRFLAQYRDIHHVTLHGPGRMLFEPLFTSTPTSLPTSTPEANTEARSNS